VRKLSGWKRIGIVASVVWAVGGFIWANNNALSRNDWIIRNKIECKAESYQRSSQGLQPGPGDLTADECETRYNKIWEKAIQHHWEEAAIFALVPIPFAWIIGWGLISIVRWVRAGFVK
jgi:hypothetical protein